MEKEKSTYCSCLSYSANALSRVMTKMADEAFANTGLTSSYAFLLMTVNKEPGINPSCISGQLQLTPSTVTRLIEKLEVKGLIERRQSGRNTEVYPTPEGMKLQKTIKEAWARLYERYTSVLGKEESKSLTQAIYAASQALE